MFLKSSPTYKKQENAVSLLKSARGWSPVAISPTSPQVDTAAARAAACQLTPTLPASPATMTAEENKEFDEELVDYEEEEETNNDEAAKGAEGKDAKK